MYLRELMEDVQKHLGSEITLHGWIRNHRRQKDFGFIDFSDGTIFQHLQLVYDKDSEAFSEIASLRVGAAIEVTGILQESSGAGQNYELKICRFTLLGDCKEDYPLQPKPHSMEFLRSIAYLRPRANIFQAVFRIRSLAAMAIHTYFQERGYVYLHAPLITASDCEGAGEMFQVTTLPLDKIKGDVDYKKDFFGKKAGLTVSGQLQGETFASAFSKIYTFGPTFRAENSNTKTHAAEFWMIEPEVAFCDLTGIMDIQEEMLKFIVRYVLDHAKDELAFLDRFVEKGLVDKLEKLTKSQFTRIKHHDVITILKEANIKWEFEPVYGEDIAKEHEKFITEYFDGPVFITDWPRDIKAFYMKQNDDGTVAAADLEVPGVGELMGGSEREADYEKLVSRMDELNMDKTEMEWYLNLRRFGSVVHSGFGMGFERLLIYLTGVDNIRDVIAYPRTPGNCDF
ncbi:MAG: asparagine--tRNA ligase [Bacilli bacterium]|nr:asparagine--tRNA ligase [Bacilli bacterium]